MIPQLRMQRSAPASASATALRPGRPWQAGHRDRAAADEGARSAHRESGGLRVPGSRASHAAATSRPARRPPSPHRAPVCPTWRHHARGWGSGTQPALTRCHHQQLLRRAVPRQCTCVRSQVATPHRGSATRTMASPHGPVARAKGRDHFSEKRKKIMIQIRAYRFTGPFWLFAKTSTE